MLPNTQFSWYLRHMRLVCLAVLPVIALACSPDQPSAPVVPKSTPVAAALAVASANGPVGAIFLPPIAPMPVPGSATPNDPSALAYLVLEICEWSGSVCVQPLVRRVPASQDGIQLAASDDFFYATWRVRGPRVRVGSTYRLRVLASGQEIGSTDLQVLSDEPPPSQPLAPGQVVFGSTLAIRFLVPRGIGAPVDSTGGRIVLAAGKVVLDVPVGAVPANTFFTAVPAIGQLPTGGPLTVPGTAWEFGPSGIQFGQQVTMSLTYDPAQLPPGVVESELRIHKLVNGTWVQQNAGVLDLVNHVASAQVSSFSIYVLIQRQFPGSVEDVQGPAINLIEFLDPVTNTYSPSITINTSVADVVLQSRVSITDDISGADYIDVRLASPSGRQMRFSCYPYPFRPPTSGSDTNGQWDCMSTWAQYSESGAWQVQVIPIRDKAFNWSGYQLGNGGVCDNSGQGIRCMAVVPQLTVVSTPSDVTPAHVAAFEVSRDVQPRSFGSNVVIDASTSSQPLVFRFHLIDALSGAGGAAQYSEFYLELQGPSGQQLTLWTCTLVQGTPFDGMWECPIVVPQSAETGVWSVRYANIVDLVGNNSFQTGRGYRPAGLQICDSDGNCVTPPTVTVSSVGDAEAPLLQAVSVSATNVDVLTTADITDNSSGTSIVWVQYVSATTTQRESCYASRTGGTATDGSYSCTITFQQYAARGRWDLEVQVWDAAGNYRLYTRRASDGFMCYAPSGGGAPICADFGTTDLILQ